MRRICYFLFNWEETSFLRWKNGISKENVLYGMFNRPFSSFQYSMSIGDHLVTILQQKEGFDLRIDNVPFEKLNYMMVDGSSRGSLALSW